MHFWYWIIDLSGEIGTPSPHPPILLYLTHQWQESVVLLSSVVVDLNFRNSVRMLGGRIYFYLYQYSEFVRCFSCQVLENLLDLQRLSAASTNALFSNFFSFYLIGETHLFVCTIDNHAFDASILARWVPECHYVSRYWGDWGWLAMESFLFNGQLNLPLFFLLVWLRPHAEQEEFNSCLCYP